MGWGSNGTANRLRANLNKRQKSSIEFYAEKWGSYHIAAKSDIYVIEKATKLAFSI
jgi:hypothetical protein